MYTPLLEEAEEAPRQIFQAVGICLVSIYSEELVKKNPTKSKKQTTK